MPVRTHIAIVDYGLGNLFSVKNACEYAGLPAVITASKQELLDADAIILPGVGAFGDAMTALRRLDLIHMFQDLAASSKPIIGICLGMQLLMTESYEFGRHKGLGIIQGSVVRFQEPTEGSCPLKIPEVGWNRIFRMNHWENSDSDPWGKTPLRGLKEGEFMYFVHSYIVHPDDPSIVLCRSRYGATEFCSSLMQRNIFAFQFHPERSGPKGLEIYRNIAHLIHEHKSIETLHDF